MRADRLRIADCGLGIVDKDGLSHCGRPPLPDNPQSAIRNPQSGGSFARALLTELLTACYDVPRGNTDYTALGIPPPGRLARLKHWIKETGIAIARAAQFVYICPDRSYLPAAASRLAAVLGDLDRLEAVYQILGDEPSRRWLIDLLNYRVLGKYRVRLPSNNPGYWQGHRLVKRKLLARPRTIAIGSLDGYLNEYDLGPIDFPVRLHAHTLNVLATFVLQQYRYSQAGVMIQAEPGDVVLDAGACWGDTALYFAHRTGETGRVFCFEFSPHNLPILHRNLELNPWLKERIAVIPKALWNEPGRTLSFQEGGPATSLTPQRDAESRVETTTIDEFVREQGLDRVDFIKMDIEGAELKALQGAEETLRTFRPKLAIALYHHPEDLVTIPEYLDRLRIGYRFFLDHFTIHGTETVLFGSVEG